MKPEYLMLAQVYKHQFVGHWYASEKLDGCRAFWDGGVSRGQITTSIPYANTIKDYRKKIPPSATGLWSRSGKVIQAPDWWLDHLPSIPLDGELYLGPKRFQELRTIVSTIGRDWDEVQYHVFDSPSWYAFGRPRDIKIRNEYSFSIRGVHNQMQTNYGFKPTPFEFMQYRLASRCSGLCVVMKQTKLPWHDYREVIDMMFHEFMEKGGEGVMLRKGSSLWVPERSHDLLKYKPCFDAEGRITGFTAGKGKYTGMIGALIIDFNGKRLELSGMTDAERVFGNAAMIEHAASMPGKDTRFTASNCFKVGDTVSFKYRELSDDGIPKEARYWREA